MLLAPLLLHHSLSPDALITISPLVSPLHSLIIVSSGGQSRRYQWRCRDSSSVPSPFSFPPFVCWLLFLVDKAVAIDDGVVIHHHPHTLVATNDVVVIRNRPATRGSSSWHTARPRDPPPLGKKDNVQSPSSPPLSGPTPMPMPTPTPTPALLLSCQQSPLPLLQLRASTTSVARRPSPPGRGLSHLDWNYEEWSWVESRLGIYFVLGK